MPDLSHDHYNKKLKRFATENRNAMTKAEACLWKYALSKKQMLGYAFRRQRPILTYIVDFICLEIGLIVEVDGYSHQLRENEVKDRIRQKKLEEKGYVVIRFTDEKVLKRITQVRAAISTQIEILVEEK
jgi:very-short-patch-repair endonuclease